MTLKMFVRLATLCWCGVAVAAGDPDPDAVLITNVSVIPMTEEKVLPKQQVLIVGDRITYVGKKKPKTGPRTQVVEGKGKFLMPGLMDMHVHLFSDESLPREHGPEEFKVILANGVTTVRLMNGYEHHLQWRDQIQQRTLVGPRLFVASPEFAGRAYMKNFHGFAVTEPRQADSLVRACKRQGYQFIKITVDVSVPVYEAIVQAAKEENIPVVGHIGSLVKLDRALEAGQQIEHLDEYLEALLRDNPDGKATSLSNANVWKKAAWQTVHQLDTGKIVQVVAKTKQYNVYNTPTSAFLHMAFGTGMDDAEIRQRPDLHYIPAADLRDMQAGRTHYLTNVIADESLRQQYMTIRNLLVKRMQEAGCKLMAGSDTPAWMLTYGFTLHRELVHLVAAGLSPYQALQAATSTPAEFLGIAQQEGTVAVGKTANLVLLNANPLQQIANTQQIAGVCRSGRYLDRQTLDQMLQEAASQLSK